MKYIYILLTAVVLYGCGNNTQAPPPPPATSVQPTKSLTEMEQVNNKKLAPPPAPTPATSSPITSAVPAKPLAEIEQLLVNSEKVDYILYNYSFSLNITQKSEVAKHVAMIWDQPVDNVDCTTAFGKVEFYDKDMNVLEEAQVHFGNNCAYYLFYKDGKKQFANKMHNNGINFFNSVIQQHSKSQQQ